MLPRLRLFAKKRGTRRTGSPWAGKLAEGLLSAGLILLGFIGVYWLIYQVAVTENAGRWPWFAMVIPLALIVYGTVAFVTALWKTAASTERRAAVVQKAADWEMPGVGSRDSIADLPTVPSIDAVTDSPGVRLAHRLPINASSGWMTFFMAAVCLTWNALVAYSVVQLALHHDESSNPWLFGWLMVPFVIAGVWTLVAFVRQLLFNIAIGTTRVEVSQHPFYPGGAFHGFVSQSGRVRVRWLQVQLVCEEQAIYQQGTDTRRAASRVFRSVLYSQRKFEIQPPHPFEVTFDLSIPETVMHSFASTHNAVVWTIVVCGRMTRWGDFERRFPVYVYPLRLTAVPIPQPLTMARA
jgi:hypothetical protein